MAKITLTLEDGDDKVIRGEDCHTTTSLWQFEPPLAQLKFDGDDDLHFPTPLQKEIWDTLTPAQKLACVAEHAIRAFRVLNGGECERQEYTGEQDLN